MQNSSLCRLYFRLSAEDRMELRQVAQQPAFNPRPEVARLLEFLEPYAGAGQNTGRATSKRRQTPVPLSKESAYAFACQAKAPGSKAVTRTPAPHYDDGKMRHLMSYTLEVLRRYLAWSDWRLDAGQVSLHLCRALKKYGLDAQFDKDLPRITAELEATPFRSSDYFFHRYTLAFEAWEYFRAGQRSGEGNLQAVGDAFGAFVAINTLRQGCAALAQNVLTLKELPIPYLQETLLLVEQGAFAGNPAVETYFFSYRALANPDNTQVFNTLKKHIEQYGSLFPDAELRDLYILAINFCIRRLNAGDRAYIQEAFGLYRAGLARKVFLENGFLARFTYRNILNLALALGEWDWALEYLHTFAPYLAPKERDNIFRYNLATYYFRRPDPEKALEILRHVEFRDVLYNFDARRMLLRIYYERQEWQALESLLDSFAVYLQRHRDAGYHREMYRNLVRFAKRLLQIRAGDTAARNRLKADIERTTHVAEREWLLGVLE